MSYNTDKRTYFSIIIATLNVERTLDKCLESIIQQTSISKIEILVIDCGSNDKTTDILHAYDKYISYWESSPDTGVYDAWNKVLSRATGEWILFLGADDTLFNHSTISNSFTILKDIDSSIDIAYGRVRLVSKENEKIADLGKNWDKTKKCIKEKMCMPHQGIFHKKSLFDQNVKFNTKYYISADYELIRKVLLESNVLYLDMIISCMRIGGISSNPQNTFTRLKEIRQINSNHGSRFPGWLWLITFANTCFRTSLFLLIGEKSGKQILDRFRMVAGLPPYWTKI